MKKGLNQMDDTTKKAKTDLKESRHALRVMGQMSQLGLTAVLCIVIGLVIGHFLDRLFNTSPILFIVFACIGMLAAIKSMVDMAKKFV